MPTGEAVAEALATIPPHMPWAWACLRTVPMIRGARVPYLADDELEELGFQPASAFPSLHMPPGVDVTFGVEVDPAHITIDQERLDAWDLTVERIAPVALGNLCRSIGSWSGGAYTDEFEMVQVRMLEGWPHWSASLVLVVDELMRTFGSGDQLFIAPYHCNLISLPIDVDRDVAADLVDLFGAINPQSLLLGLPAFVLRDGQLSTEELPGSAEPFDDEDDEEDL